MNIRGGRAGLWGFIGVWALLLGAWGAARIPHSEAADSNSRSRPTTGNWFASRPLRIPSVVAKGESVEFLFLQKLAPLPRGGVHSPANVVFFDIPKSRDEAGAVLAPSVAEELRKGLGLGSWRIRNFGASAKVFEAYWEGGGRLVRIFASEDAKRFRYSIAMVRPGYSKPAYLESELMQRRHIEGRDPRTAMTSRHHPRWFAMASELAAAWIPVALAESGIPASGAAPGGSSAASGAAGAAAGYLSTGGGSAGVIMGGAFHSASMTDEQIEELIDTVNATSGTWEGLLTETGEAAAAESSQWRMESAAWRDLMGDYSDQIDRIEGDVLKRVDSALALGDRAMDLAEKVTSPGYAALVGAAGAAGAVVGGFAVNAALDGLVMGGKALIELLKDSKNKDERLARFIQAREFWEKTSPLAAQAEKQLDLMLSILEKSAERGLGRKEMKAATLAMIIQKQEDLGRLRKRLDAAAPDCSTVVLREDYSRISEELLPMVRVLCVVEPDAVPGLRIDDTLPQATCEKDSSSAFDKICSDSFNAFAQLAMLESQLQTAREAIRAGSAEYQRQVREEMEKDERSHRWSGPQSEKAEKLAEKTGRGTVASLRKEVERKYRRQKEAFVSLCTQRCRIEERSGPEWTVSTATMVPEKCAADIEIMLIRCQVPPEVGVSVQAAVGDCHSREECRTRIDSLFAGGDKLQKECSLDVQARIDWCMRDKTRSTVQAETAMTCRPAGERYDGIASASQQASLVRSCEDEFMRQPGAGMAYADEMREIDRAAVGVADLLVIASEGNADIESRARLRDAAVSLNPLLASLQLIDQVNREFLASDSTKLPELAEKGERLKAACEKVNRRH